MVTTIPDYAFPRLATLAGKDFIFPGSSGSLGLVPALGPDTGLGWWVI